MAVQFSAFGATDMKNRYCITALVVLLAAGVASMRQAARFRNQPTAQNFISPVPMNPEIREALKAKGKAFRLPNFPASVNRGRKFNPGGATIPPLITATQQKVLVLFVDFTTPPPGGTTARLPLGYFDDMLFGTIYDPPEYAPYAGHPTDRTLRNYYQQVSYGAVDVVTLNMPSALGWKSAGQPYDYYCKADGIHDNGFGPYPRNAQGMVVDAIKAADAAVDFSVYAIDGEVPNLFVVFAGTGAEWSGDPSVIWSHSWAVSAGTDHPSGYLADGVIINNYAVMPEVGGDLTGVTGVPSWKGPFPPTVGVYAHEYGHVLGLPDQYDYGYESEGTGMYSLMAGGSWNYSPKSIIFSGNSPAHLDAWSKYRLGFVNPPEALGAITLRDAERYADVVKVTAPNSGGKEYFLLENRQPIGFDEGLTRVLRNASGQLYLAELRGLAIYHVDDTVLTRTYWRPNEAENWKEWRSEGWRKAPNGETHYGISLIQADGRWDLEHGANQGDPGDLYPGALGVTYFTSYTTPNSSSYYFWPGLVPKFGYTGVSITGISESLKVVTAHVGFDR
jgi:immune inhibitor A